LQTLELGDLRLATERSDGLVYKNVVRRAYLRFQLPFPITYVSIFEVGEYLITRSTFLYNARCH
jgi:hypothetical protein